MSGLSLDEQHLKQLCFDTRAMSLFLKASRAASDDSIASRLSPDCCSQVFDRVTSEWRKRDSMLAHCEALASKCGEAPSNIAAGHSIAELAQNARQHINFPTSTSDPRIDSYAARDETMVEESFDAVSAFIDREKTCETIIRPLTSSVFAKKCDRSGLEPTLLAKYTQGK